MSAVDDFAAGYDHPLDDFQVAGVRALAEDRSVLVAAPTGAGKTLVGEFAVWQALHAGGKCFYTTPIKALSNQKHADLVRRHGARNVGLLTGDNVVNGDAPVVVMTTEVLRNMLYEGSRALVGLHAVVLDEVHYLADRQRGAVWEEVIISLPPSVQLACLSATVSNAEEFGGWLAQVRGGCDIVISEHRPVPLEHSYAVNDRLYPVFRAGSGGASGRKARAQDVAAANQARGGQPNPEVLMLERRSGSSGRPSRSGRRQHGGVRLRPPRRSDLVAELGRRRWLPAIVFVFSRAGCDDAVDQLVRDGVRLTRPAEAARIRQVVDERTAELSPDDLEVLGYGPWAAALELGIAAHHAGMVAPFKETVEELFTAGLVKVCFATETLALGINMPARTVVIERLEKWNGARHELLTPGQFTQLTGRAGRRGLDELGHAVVSYQRDVDFPTVAGLVGRRVSPLHSSFAPSYNMAVNLLRRLDRAEAEALLARSFAQYEADAQVASDAERIARNHEALAGYAAHLHSSRGDFAEYWDLRRELSRLESAGAAERRRRATTDITDGLAALAPGDVVALPRGGDDADLVAIVSRTSAKSGTPLAGAVTEDRKLVRLGPREFVAPPMKVGFVALPSDGGPRQAGYRKEVANALRRLDVAPRPGRVRPPADGDHTEQVARLRAALRDHPVHDDPELAEIEVWARRRDDLAKRTATLERTVRQRTGSLVRAFERICGVLTDLGYLDGADDPSPTADGLRLAALYADTDLVLAETIRAGGLDDLDAAGLAAVVSCFTYETRGKEAPVPVLPGGAAVREAVDTAMRCYDDVAKREEAAGLAVTRPLDAGFAEVVHRWAGGADLLTALGSSPMTAGDFVRAAKQVADLLRQLRDATSGALAETAHSAARGILRGVVAYTGV